MLNGSDDDIDELDDEVAMISNKKDTHKKNDIVSTNDIKIVLVDDTSHLKKQGGNKVIN